MHATRENFCTKRNRIFLIDMGFDELGTYWRMCGFGGGDCHGIRGTQLPNCANMRVDMKISNIIKRSLFVQRARFKPYSSTTLDSKS
jgi:hypothetical protein